MQCKLAACGTLYSEITNSGQESVKTEQALKFHHILYLAASAARRELYMVRCDVGLSKRVIVVLALSSASLLLPTSEPTRF